MPKPGDFFIGIAEFFGSLAPGIVLVALLWRLGSIPGFADEGGRNLVGFEGSAVVTALIVAGYLAGHFVSVVGSRLDHLYDPVRKRIYRKSKDWAYRAAKDLWSSELPLVPKLPGEEERDDERPMNTFQWARAVLAVEQRDAFDDVTRLEAASKLFRSMVVVALIVAAAAAWHSELEVTGLAILGAILSFFPYVDRRYKSTETAYRLVIVLRTPRPAVTPP